MKFYRRLPFAVAATALTAATAFAAPSALAGRVASGNELPDPSTYDAAIAWLPDTQYYAESYPEHFDNQTKWLVDNAEQRKISYAAHTGDIVDNADEDQWKNADASMKKLDEAKFPYGVVEGNHDKDGLYSDYFGEKRFAGSPVYGESYENNRQHYDLVDVGGKQVIMLYLTWGMEEGDFAWAEKVLADHPDMTSSFPRTEASRHAGVTQWLRRVLVWWRSRHLDQWSVWASGCVGRVWVAQSRLISLQDNGIRCSSSVARAPF